MKRVFFLLPSLLLFTGCHFQTLNQAEQKSLSSKPGFMSPGWFNGGARQGNGGQGSGRVATGGLIQETVTPPMAIHERLDSYAPTQVVLPTKDEKKELAEQHDTADSIPYSPLARIHKLCPQVESRVNEALTTTEIRKQIPQYEVIISQCPNSPDLLVWLGNAYLQDSRFADAQQAYKQALSIDPNQQDAILGLKKVDQAVDALNQ